MSKKNKDWKIILEYGKEIPGFFETQISWFQAKFNDSEDILLINKISVNIVNEERDIIYHDPELYSYGEYECYINMDAKYEALIKAVELFKKWIEPNDAKT